MASSLRNPIVAKFSKFLKRRLSIVLAKSRYEEMMTSSHIEEAIENELNEALEAQLLAILANKPQQFPHQQASQTLIAF